MKKLIIGIFISYSLFGNSQSVKINKIEKHLTNMSLNDEYSGVVLIAKDENILLERAYGLAQEDEKITNTLDTKFGLASIGKMFTAISVMQLKEQGKLKLKTRVGDVLPNYKNKIVRDSVTIHHLLTHTSGLGDFFNEKYMQRGANTIRNLEDYLSFFEKDSLLFSPGERFGYSNAGYIVLGLIVEKLSGKSYYDYTNEYIFKPTHMNSSGWSAGDVESTTVKILEKKSIVGSSAGGGYSTAKDILKFVTALKENRLISKESFEQMTTAKTKEGYGYGFSTLTIGDQYIFGHSGGAPGVSGELDIYKNSGYVVISLSNKSALDGWAEVRNFIRSTLAGSSEEIEIFFNTKKVLKTYEKFGFDAAIIELETLNSKVKDEHIFHYGDNYRQQKNHKKAIEVMRILVAAFPDAWYTVSFLADTYLDAGKKELAIKNYKKSLKLNPQNRWAIDKLKEIDGN